RGASPDAVVSVVASAIGLLQCLCSGDLALAQDGVQAGDLPLGLAHPCGVVLLAGGQLEPQVEQRLLGLAEAADQLVVVEVAQRRALLRHQTSASTPARITNLALIGSFWMARSMASLAS